LGLITYITKSKLCPQVINFSYCEPDMSIVPNDCFLEKVHACWAVVELDGEVALGQEIVCCDYTTYT